LFRAFGSENCDKRHLQVCSYKYLHNRSIESHEENVLVIMLKLLC
jgi:hypothetical protein